MTDFLKIQPFSYSSKIGSAFQISFLLKSEYRYLSIWLFVNYCKMTLFTANVMYHIWRPKSYYRREQYMAIRDADPDARSSPLSADEIQTLQHLLQRFQNSGNSRHCFNFYLLFSIFSAYRIVLSQMMVKPL